MLKRSDAEMFGMLDEALAIGYKPVGGGETLEPLPTPIEVTKPSVKNEVAKLAFGGLLQQAHDAHASAA